ncbi:DUF2201 family putative metallopeptidase [Ktedonospora formicarum]|uniref:Hydrolase n=1 Tax=Ktedonospora formicarum TaxID=2778364 RepID=A0A8J3I5N3_9CHLR|nr:VWA-like domain-containing protein [Ktedonospora formicarum]GHO47265.1 hydrolase [Ktedonospora formicarum]
MAQKKQSDALQRQITASILKLRIRSPFFATLALFAHLFITESIPTAATNGRDIFFNEQFWSHLTEPERLGVVAHEIMHAALLHVPRRGSREPQLWNIAADIVVNGIVLAQEGFALPAGHIREKSLEHLSVEEVYHKLQSHFKRHPHLGMPDLLDPTDQEKRPYAELEQYWRQALQQAQTLTEVIGQGKVPAGLQREISHLNPAQLDWRSYLWRFLGQTPTDFQGFDRRFVGQGLYLEALEGETVRVYVAVDTSGSIGSAEIAQFLGEVRGILSTYPHLEASLYYTDAACYGPYPLTLQSAFPQPIGGGGTDFRPFFRAVMGEHDAVQPRVCVYCTDGYGTFPTEAPPLPVLWVLSPGSLDMRAIPFGEAVRLIPDM